MLLKTYIHLQNSRNDDLSELEGDECCDTTKSSAPCILCDKILPSLNALRVRNGHHHMQVRPYQFSRCGGKYANGARLSTHWKIVHLKKYSHECQTCGVKFDRADKLKIHVTFQLEEHPHKCLTCSHSYESRNSLSRHCKVTKHVPMEEHPCKCQTCGLSYKSQYYLSRHSKRMKHYNQNVVDR